MLFKIISKKNYLFDLIEKKEFKDLRNNLIQILKKDENFNYGFGYFYQSLNEIGITGLRNSESRLDQYNIKDIYYPNWDEINKTNSDSSETDSDY